MCFKIVFGLNTYSVTIDLDQTEHYLSAGGYEFIISLTKERYCRHENKFVLTHGQVMPPQGCQKDFV